MSVGDAQAEPIRYLHAGMVQHDPSGLPAFLHRTAEGKVYPFNHGYRKARPFPLQFSGSSFPDKSLISVDHSNASLTSWRGNLLHDIQSRCGKTVRLCNTVK